MRWIARGTHQWDKFVTPNELEAATERAGLQAIDQRGAVYNFFADSWSLSSNLDVNYFLTARRTSS